METNSKKEEALDLRGMNENTDTLQATKIQERIAWETEEFPYHEKDTQWFLLAGIVVGGIIISLLIMGNVFGAVTFLLFAIIGYLYATKKPEMLSVEINTKGVSVNNKLIPYSHIASFWIFYEPPLKDLIIIQKEKFTIKTIIPLNDAHPVDVRTLLLHNAITEKEEEESFAEILSRRFRF